ncbi:hypothetical protein DH2020_006946 [Rehmannia glutinosa]|uniref:Uncharacterized protein n=1 Tax=Rehmannia glutinosa TaxID=99300 RepID=A0ABR0XKE2_REHGL
MELKRSTFSTRYIPPEHTTWRSPEEKTIFDEEDMSLEGEHPATPIVISVVVANLCVKRVLVDIGPRSEKIPILGEVMFPLSGSDYHLGHQNFEICGAQECHIIAWKEEPQAWDLELWNELITPMEVCLLQEENYPEEHQEEEDYDVLKLKEEPKLEVVEQIKLVVLDPTDETKTVRFGRVEPGLEQEIIEVLRRKSPGR